MKICLNRVSIERKEILYRLLEYSLYEESLNDGNEMNDQGLFEYKDFDDYFNDNNKEAFFIREERTNKLLGFVMINNTSNGHSIEEFMVIPKYRRNNIGKETAFSCFDMYHGNWKISPSIGSEQAYEFWERVVEEYTKNNYQFVDGVLIFNNE